MEIRFFHIDAFCDQVFQGNPAAVCLLPQWLETETLQCLAAEHHLPVTAFLVREASGFSIRWFTPQIELDLCGHGTLAAAFAILMILEPTLKLVDLHSEKAGVITVNRCGTELEFQFPAKKIEQIDCDALLIKALKVVPEAVYCCDNDRLMVLLPTELMVKNALLDIVCLKQLGYRGIIICALSDSVDFVSRTFYPDKPIPEDAVTGASHCYLAPYFANRLKKSVLKTRQLSARGGSLSIRVSEKVIAIKAQAVLYSQGLITLG